MTEKEAKDQIEITVNTKPKHRLKVESLSRDISKASWDSWKTTEDLWKLLNAIPDDKIEKFEWNFILKSLGKDGEILPQNDADFLFDYMDKDNSGDISKAELRAVLDLVVRNNKWSGTNSPTKQEMIQATYQYALKEKKNHSAIDYTLQIAIISAKNSLTNLLKEMRSAKGHYGLVTSAIGKNNRHIFPNPRKIFDDQLKDHEDVINKYAAGPLKTHYEKVKALLAVTQEEYDVVHSQVHDFLVQGQELEILRAKDEKCCKIFGCLCPCTF